MKLSGSIAVIGAGCSGTAISIEILKREIATDLYLIDSNPLLHRGVAYGTNQISHLLNVPAKKMSIVFDEPDHFMNWLDKTGYTAQPENFIPRRIYGQYLEDTFNQVKRKSKTSVSLIPSQAVSLEQKSSSFLISVKNGDKLVADKIILACGWGNSYSTSNSMRIHDNPYKLPRSISKGELAVIIGTGLTAIDTFLTIRNSGFKGKIAMISRRGVLTNPHRLSDLFDSETFNPHTVKGLNLRKIFRLLKSRSIEREKAGLSWQGLLDSFRPYTQEFWLSLSTKEKSRFLRHARPYWDAHRHRMPDEVARLVEAEVLGENIEIVAANVLSVNEDSEFVDIKIRKRGEDKILTLKADYLVRASGVNTFSSSSPSPLNDSMILNKLVSMDALSLGFNVNPDYEILNPDGNVSPGMYAFGPLARGTFWETTAVPEISQAAAKIADRLGTGP